MSQNEPDYNRPAPVLEHGTPSVPQPTVLRIGDPLWSFRGGYLPYNPDVQPFQFPLFRRTGFDIEIPQCREQLLRESPFLRSHTYDVLDDIFRLGWSYENGKSIPEWSNDLKQATIDAISKALVIGTSYIVGYAKAQKIVTPMAVWNAVEPKAKDKAKENNAAKDEDLYFVFTQCDVHKAFINQNRQFTEVYAKFTRGWYEDNVYYDVPDQLGGISVKNQIVGFLTQYCDVLERPSRCSQDNETNISNRSIVATIAGTKKDPENEEELRGYKNTLKKVGVVVQPKKSIHSVYGEPILYSASITALQKHYLRFYEFIILDKGGVNRTILVPENIDEGMYQSILLDTQRGIKSRGLAYKIRLGAQDDIRSKILVQSDPIPTLDFSVINDHVSEDAILTKQGVEGTSESNGLSGKAGVVMDKKDNIWTKNVYNMIEQVIYDINEVMFGVEPTYDITFNEPEIPLETQLMLEEAKMGGSQVAKDAGTKKDSDSNAKKKPTAHENAIQVDDDDLDMLAHNLAIKALENLFPNPVENEYEHSTIDCQILENAMTDQYVVFEGNMLQAGQYEYKNKTTGKKFYITYSEQDIKDLVNRDPPGRSCYLDVNHTGDPIEIDRTEGLGYAMVKGYDPKEKMDITDFYVYRKAWEKLGCPKNIKVSPKFYPNTDSQNPDRHNIQLINCAIVVGEYTPRAELTGLRSEAKLKQL